MRVRCEGTTNELGAFLEEVVFESFEILCFKGI
ncbi:MAG: hypothetical protein ACJA1W_004303 [Akkermansiaceae bacterium]|jgi:hypothetical protein